MTPFACIEESLMRKIASSLFLVVVISLCGCHNVKADESYIVEIGEGTWRLGPKDSVNIYLLVGEDRALVIDTGYGDFDIPEVIGRITKLPVIVANTHGHPDHSGGNRYFPTVAGGAGDTKMIYYFSKVAYDKILVETLCDGEVIDLGSRLVRVIATPGHTAGSLCFFDEGQRMLFTGDTSNTMTWMFLSDATTLEAYSASLEKLALIVGADITLYPGHGTAEDETLIASLHQCAEAVLSGARGEPYRVSAGEGLNYSTGGVSVVYNPTRLR